MPSSAVTKSGNGVVRCRIVNDEIPIAICEKEQGAHACEGCSAPSRRCKNCGKARGIADPERGLCTGCLKPEDIVVRTVTLEGTAETAIGKALDRVRGLATGDGKPEGGTKLPHKAPVVPATQKPKDPSTLYQALMEHGTERDGIWKVQMPVAILMRRFHLLREETIAVLEKLVKSGRLRGEMPWNEIVLLKTDGIEELKDKTEFAKGGAAHSPSRKAPKFISAEKQTASTESASSLVTSLPSQRPAATYGEIYGHLKSRANDVRGELLVGGSVPALQIRFKLNAPQVIESLEWLKTSGHIQQKDGWRTIALLAESVTSEEGPARLTGNVTTNARTVPSPSRRETEPRAVVRPEKPSLPPVMKPVSDPPPSKPIACDPDALQEGIAELERKLPELRKNRDELVMQVAQLEVAYINLKALQGQITHTSHLANAALTEAKNAARDLLAKLRK